ncbi:MAG: sulfotransferase domain-containing protein [Chloroflexi bacterium]|nr:sulfotransferase domain-containing protein [Chloroflexota bacterium]
MAEARLFSKARGRLDQLAWLPRLAWLRARGRRRVALSSYPRSGNTWLRGLIEAATGQASGSIYSDAVMRRGADGVVIKTHAWDMHRYTHAVLVVRHPFDALPSYFHYRQNIWKETGLTWETFLLGAIEEWRGHTARWLAAGRRMPLYRLRYEDLLAEPQEELAKLLAWLGFDLPPERVAAAIDHNALEKMRARHPRLGGEFFRRGLSGVGVEEFSEAERGLVRERLGDLLAELGYDGGEV